MGTGAPAWLHWLSAHNLGRQGVRQRRAARGRAAPSRRLVRASGGPDEEGSSENEGSLSFTSNRNASLGYMVRSRLRAWRPDTSLTQSVCIL